MKLCPLIVVAVAIATCHALPVPQEEVFTVYPVNSGLAQNTTDLPVETKQAKADVPAVVPADLTNEKEAALTDADKPVDRKLEQPTTVSEEAKQKTTVNEEGVKAASQPNSAPETKSAPMKESAPVAAAAETPVAAASSKDDAVTVVKENEARDAVGQPAAPVVPQSLVAEESNAKQVSETKSVVDETKPVDKKEPVPAEKAASDEKPKPAAATPSQENVLKPTATTQEEKKLDAPEVSKVEHSNPVEPEVKEKVAENKQEKLTEEPKVEASPETTEARSATNDHLATEPKPVPQPKLKDDVKSPAELVAKVETEKEEEMKPVEEKPVEPKVTVAVEPKSDLVEDTKQSLLTATDPQPRTEGKAEEKPTKVRAAPIVEGLKVSQPVEAEPAIAKIHVTVIQEEFPIREQSVVAKEPEQDAPAVVAKEKKPEDDTVSTPDVKSEDVSEKSSVVVMEASVVKSPEVKSADDAPQKPAESTDESLSGKPAEIKSTESEDKQTAEKIDAKDDKTPEVMEAEPSTESSQAAEPVVVKVRSVNDEAFTTVAAPAEETDKPAAVVKDQAEQATETKATPEATPVTVSEESTTIAVDEKLERKDDEQQAKAAEGSSQPAPTKSSETVKEDTKDQGNSDGTTVTEAADADSTTVSGITDPEPVPTPAKQKGKKQVPPNLKGYSKRLKQQEAQRKQTDNE